MPRYVIIERNELNTKLNLNALPIDDNIVGASNSARLAAGKMHAFVSGNLLHRYMYVLFYAPLFTSTTNSVTQRHIVCI